MQNIYENVKCNINNKYIIFTFPERTILSILYPPIFHDLNHLAAYSRPNAQPSFFPMHFGPFKWLWTYLVKPQENKVHSVLDTATLRHYSCLSHRWLPTSRTPQLEDFSFLYLKYEFFLSLVFDRDKKHVFVIDRL